ncbi:unnamed protein product [Prunus brigantina]
MVSKSQSKEAQAAKGQGKDIAVSKAQMAESKSVPSNPAKKMRFTSSSEKDPSSATFDEVTKSTRRINTMSRVMKRKIQKIKPVVECNKSGRPHGKAAIEMQSYIGVLARTRVPLVDKKGTQLPKDLKEQIWEAVQMAYVVGEGGKKMVMSSAAKKWKDFKSTLTRQLSTDFEAVHSEQSQRREKCEYNHRLSRKGYVGLEDQLEETMPSEEIDRSLLWKKAREDKQRNIPNPKVAEKVKLIDDLKKQVSEGTLTVSGSNDVLTMDLGTPEHGGRVRGVGAGVSPTQFFNLPRQQRVKFADKLKESVMAAVREETKKMEARAKESVMEAVRAEMVIMLIQFSQLIPNFDPNMLSKIPTTPTTPITPIPPIPQQQSPKNPMSDKASCSNVRALELDEDNPMNDADAAENCQDQTDLSTIDMPTPLLALCQYVETKLKPANETITVQMPEEMFSTDHDTWILSEDILQFASMVEIGATVIAVYMRYLFDYLKMAKMVKLVGLVDSGQVSSQSGTLYQHSKHLSESLKKANGDQFYLVPYNPGGHWVLIIVRPDKETVYYMNSLPNRSVDEDMRNIVNTSIKMYNSHTGKQSSRKSPIWKNLQGTPRQPTNVECGYYVMRFMRDIIHDPALAFEKKSSLKWNGDGRIRLWFFVNHDDVCEMDKSWMHADRRSKAYELGVEGFLNFAVENLLNTIHVRCPCVKCGNIRLFGVGIIRDHLYFNGIDQSYKIWTWHGEPLEWTTNASRNVEEDEQCGFSFVSEEVGMDDNDLGDIGFDPYEFANVIEDGDQPLYPGSSKYTMFSALVKLYNLKAKHGMSDVCFTELLILQGNLLPEGNTLPSSMYEAKKTLSALGMSYEKIHACPNDCILYRKDYEDSTNCPICGVSRWKECKDSILKEGVPAKVVWHDARKSVDDQMSHPADSPSWKLDDDDKWPEFGKEPRNLILALSSDGFNPHSSLSSRYSCWPVILVIYNLPPWLCMKWKFMMLTLLISGPKQPGNDIDVYLETLIDDLKSLWDGIRGVYDAHIGKYVLYTQRCIIVDS